MIFFRRLSHGLASVRVSPVTKSVVHLFCDTNLLFQCKPLEELDWSPWVSHEVRVVVTKPVLREVDYRKTHGNSRVANRARAASAIFRRMLPAGEKVVRDAGPRVSLHIEAHHQHSPQLGETLNYEERDDQLVGTLHRFAMDNADEDARLLTHDTGPIYTAIGLGLKVEMIPDDWLLPPENDEQRKRISELERELSNYRREEPSFEIQLLDAEGNEADCYDACLKWYEPLTTEEVDGLMEELRRRCPIVDLGVPSTSSSLARDIALIHPPFAKYRDKDYPRWLQSCRQILSNIHHLLRWEQPAAAFTFIAANRGTRPASHALVTVEALGSVRIMPPREPGDRKPVLPSPPRPPRLQGTSAHGGMEIPCLSLISMGCLMARHFGGTTTSFTSRTSPRNHETRSALHVISGVMQVARRNFPERCTSPTLTEMVRSCCESKPRTSRSRS